MATPKDNPLRVEFDRLHQASVRIEVAVLLIGVAGLFFTVRSLGGSVERKAKSEGSKLTAETQKAHEKV